MGGKNDLIRHRGAAGLIFCDTCEEMRPDVEFLEIEYQVGSGGTFGGEHDSNPVACQRCRTQGPPPLDPLSALTAREIKAIEALAGGHNVAAAARIAGIPKTTLQAKLEGRITPQFRRGWQKLLHHKGLTLVKIAEKAAELLEAKDRKWNPSAEKFDEFPDNRTQLATVRFAATQLGMDPPKEAPAAAGGGGPTFIFNTNLGQSDGRESSADYVLRRAKLVQTTDVEAGEDG